MPRRGLLASLVLALGLAGCRGAEQHEYPAEVVDAFVTACTARADERTCRCAIDRLRERYTFDEYKAREARIADRAVVQEMAETVDSCR